MGAEVGATTSIFAYDDFNGKIPCFQQIGKMQLKAASIIKT